jgi:hypothetical protein
MKQCAVAAAQRNSRPAFITKTNQTTPESNAVGRDIAAIGDSSLGSVEATAFHHGSHADALLADVEAIRRSNVELEENAITQMQTTIQQKNAGEGWQELMHVKRSYNVAASGNSTVVVDNATGALTFPEVVGAKQFMSAFIALPPNHSLESPPTATAPAQLAEFTEVYRDVVAGVMGVPSVLWGSTRSSVAANQTVLNTFNDTKQWYRVILQTVIRCLFGVMFRERLDAQNLVELREVIKTLTHDKDAEKVRRSHKQRTQGDKNISVALPGMFDLEVLTNLQALGLMAHDSLADAAAAYLGLPREMFAEEKIDPESGKPCSEVQKETEQHEEHVMEKQSELKIKETKESAKIPPAKKPMGSATKKARTK